MIGGVPTPAPTAKLVAFVAIMLVGCMNPAPNNEPAVVTYEVSFSAERVDIHYKNATGGTTSVSASNNVKKVIGNEEETWTQEEPLPDDGLAYISAQIGSGYGGEVTVSIKRRGYQTKTSTSSGQYAIADASARYR